ncbi:integrase catalytic domain-containing protein [Trichonephila clavipes]|nr:integrase catalytic domain-containing protein [Trichonephila clavipes]
MNRSVENKSCIVCKDKTLHPIFRCKRFLELNPEKRLDLVRLHKLCELCLRKNHKRMQCTSTYVCPCGKKHSRSLCTAAIDDRKKWVIPSAELPVLTNPEDRESNVVDSSTQNTVLSSTASQHRKNVLISTGSVFLRNNEGRELKCPVIFDSAETEFGWIAGGRLQGTNNNFSCYFLKDNDSVDDTLKLFFELESLGIKDDPCYRKDDQAMNIFKETVQYNNNRYVVELPFRKHWNELSNNISVAKQRFQSLWGRLRRDKTLYTQYKETIQDYLNQGIIEKAFLQICLADKHKDFVRFLWTDSNPRIGEKLTLQVYRFNRVIFGVNSSPFLLAATIKYHIEKYNEIHPITVQHLDSFMYVDDWITGQDTREEALFMSRHAKNIMKEAGMEMRKWISNDTVLMAQWAAEGFDTHPMDASIRLGTNKTKVLGMAWQTLDDCLTLDTKVAARLSSRVQEIVRKKKECKVFHWTDSKIVLFWIKGSSKRWKQFVANRVQEISELTDPDSWFHCSGQDNPSDFLSRGLNVDTLISNNKWWTGPAFLRTDELPKTVSECPELNEVDYLPELNSKDSKEHTVLTLNFNQTFLIIYFLVVISF